MDGLSRRRSGEVGNTPHIRIEGVLGRFPTPDVLEGNRAFDSDVALTPGEGDIAVHIPARHFDSGVKLIAQEPRLSVHDRVEWRPWWGTGVTRP